MGRKERCGDLSDCEDAMAADGGRGIGAREDWPDDAGRYVMSVAVSMTGVDAHRIRKYEDVGLVKPSRSRGGQRLFSDPDVARIREIARLESEGVNLKGVEVILRMQGDDVRCGGGVGQGTDPRKASSDNYKDGGN